MCSQSRMSTPQCPCSGQQLGSEQREPGGGWKRSKTPACLPVCLSVCLPAEPKCNARRSSALVPTEPQTLLLSACCAAEVKCVCVLLAFGWGPLANGCPHGIALHPPPSVDGPTAWPTWGKLNDFVWLKEASEPDPDPRPTNGTGLGPKHRTDWRAAGWPDWQA